MRKIYLSGKRGAGLFAKIDDEDFPIVSKYKWYLSTCGYAITNYWKGRKNHFHLMLHHLVFGKKKGLTIDHINRDKLDNRKENLRVATFSLNRINNSARADSKSGIKGVCWKKREKKWVAQININGKRKWLGNFINKEDAANTYDKVAKQIYKNFAYLNNLKQLWQ
jgi:hypothetical protein